MRETVTFWRVKALIFKTARLIQNLCEAEVEAIKKTSVYIHLKLIAGWNNY